MYIRQGQLTKEVQYIVSMIYAGTEPQRLVLLWLVSSLTPLNPSSVCQGGDYIHEIPTQVAVSAAWCSF